MSPHIRIERPAAAPGVQVIRLDRPEKKNAITRAMYAAMTGALTAGDDDEAVRATVFLGMEGCFSAGNDLADFMAAAEDGVMGAEVLAFLHALAAHRKPLLSGVDGLAIGIGTTIHLHCDLTYASDRAVFRTPFVDLGLVPEAASSLLAPRVMGHQRAFALLAAGETFSAAAAREAGLIYAVVAPDMLEEATLAAAAGLAARPAAALAIARDLLRDERQAVADRIDLEAAHFARQLQSPEARAALAAFLDRR
ncbi:crotonase/enoyl-CoA hydratase family protein [Shinella daejeonensis]|uniref:crotonase/enoyl-CoA hydratase family protein n=1 Tax=Shinella daejeonensis TaxID=659017 RepID=UPI0020C75F69|nr:crotonase/enoyl-CoA hydratase family protein [Shinella daejeonensis]MCP8897170.1 crotonase/enoyl-CoA hydratase family protein [Shinella daejeonensis]